MLRQIKIKNIDKALENCLEKVDNVFMKDFGSLL